MPRPPAPRGSRRAAPSRLRAVLLQLRPPLNQPSRAPPAASPSGSWRGWGLRAAGDPASRGPAPAPRAPPGGARDTPPRGCRSGLAAGFLWLAALRLPRWLNPESPVQTASGGASVWGGFPNLPETGSSSVIRPPAPCSDRSGFGEGRSRAGSFLCCHHITHPFPGSSGWLWRMLRQGAPRTLWRPAAVSPCTEPRQRAPPEG